MNYRTVSLNRNRQPREYAFSCFDNAVRFAYYHQANNPESTYYVVAGQNQFGIHYGYLRIDNDGFESVDDFGSPFINGVEMRLSLDLAISLRNYMLSNNITRVSPCSDQPESNFMTRRSTRFIPDGLVALAPRIHLVNEFMTTGQMTLNNN